MANIQDVRTIQTPQFSYQWEIEISGLASGGLGAMAAYAKTVSIPQTAVEQVVINHKSSKTHFAGRDSSAKTVTITFWDDEAATIQNYFDSWMRLIREPLTGSQVSREVYQSDLIIRLRNSSDDTTTATYTMTKAFPTDMADVSLSYDSSEPVEISVTLSFDEKLLS